MRAFRVGVAGPVGSGKTALVDCLSRELTTLYSLGVVTNDIYTKEDAEFLIRQGTLPEERIRGVETGGCPHAAIREDASMNLEAIADLESKLPGLELIFVESGGDNLAAMFSPELVDVSIYVIDVAGGDKIPRKGGPGITRSDLLVINKIDLAPLVGASLEVMDRDARRMRGERPFVFTNLKTGDGSDRIVDFVVTQGGLANFDAVTIRPYRDQDLEATARLWLASWRSTGLAVALRSTESELFALNERIPRELAAGWAAYLAWTDDKPVGFLALNPASGRLDQLFVLPEAQGRGIGRALLDFAKRRLPEGLSLRTAVENFRACAFYEREGCRRGEAQPHPTLGHMTVTYRWP